MRKSAKFFAARRDYYGVYEKMTPPRKKKLTVERRMKQPNEDTTFRRKKWRSSPYMSLFALLARVLCGCRKKQTSENNVEGDGIIFSTKALS